MSAEKGWIGEPQPPGREYIPGEERKWRIMMGNGQLLTDEDEDGLSRFLGEEGRVRPRAEQDRQAAQDRLQRPVSHPEKKRGD